jgi:hypothetical protein
MLTNRNLILQWEVPEGLVSLLQQLSLKERLRMILRILCLNLGIINIIEDQQQMYKNKERLFR